eukprot:TRINITY_DN91022_c0_g1_i1.p1 TRINITY_DN91022_c0_g1~~TRINITY_DN91022_c0_g1_i1.p1  ORF type:complete len:332 (+),score=73.80 TRINITY_DN91022_c0_g1_i1:88-1083(+)
MARSAEQANVSASAAVAGGDDAHDPFSPRLEDALAAVEADAPEAPAVGPASKEAVRHCSEYEALLAENQFSPLEWAVMAKLRAWETGSEGYSYDEMMEVTQFLEMKMEPKKRLKHKQKVLHEQWLEFEKDAKLGWCLPRRWKQRLPTIAMGLSILLALGSVVGLTIAAARISRLVFLESSGRVSGRGVPAVGTGAAVQVRTLQAYPTMPFEDLRRLEDVVLRQAGDFCFFRVASVTQLPPTSGRAGVRIVSQDGTLIKVEHTGNATIRRPWRTDEVADYAHGLGKDAWSFDGGLLRHMATVPEMVGGAGLPAPTLRVAASEANSTGQNVTQ